MFVMTSDGGVLKDNPSSASSERILLQRVFLFSLLSQGVSVTLLKGAEYRDSKVHTSRYASTFPHICIDHVLCLRTTPRKGSKSSLR